MKYRVWGPGDEPAPTQDEPRPLIKVAAGKDQCLYSTRPRARFSRPMLTFSSAPSAWCAQVSTVSAADGRTTIAAGLHPLDTAALIEELTRVSDWQRFDARSKDWVAIDPPGLVARVLASRKGKWKVRTINCITCCPTLRPDGSIFSTPGYDAATRLYLMPDPGLRLPDVPERPRREQAEAALGSLKSLLIEFPFVADCDRAVALSLLISAVVRARLIWFRSMPSRRRRQAAARASADVTSAIVSGRWCPVITAGKTEEELEKRLGAMLLAGYLMIALDNISDRTERRALCQIAERPSVRVRILGESRTPECEFRGIIIANGNNLVVEGDMTRRVLLGTLDANMERPEERTFRGDPVRQVLTDRGAYIAAAMTIVRAYIGAGSPGKLPALASYARWSDLVRSALVWLGEADRVETIAKSRESDPVLTTLRTVLAAWRDAFGDEARGSQQVAAALAGFDPEGPDGAALTTLRAALAPVCAARGIIDATRLGYWLKRSKGRPAGTLKFITDGTAHRGVASWRVIQG